MLDFKSEKERQSWIIAHAEYFSVIEAKNNPARRERHEVKTLLEAEDLAQDLCQLRHGSRWLIYAVAKFIETYVKTIS